VVETERLRLERLHRDRVDPYDYYDVVGDADALDGVVEHMPWDVHAHPKESVEYLARSEDQWDDGEKATWLVRPREGDAGTEAAAAEDSTEADAAEDGAGAIAGQTGLHPEWDRQLATLGVWLRPEFWGRGYSGERAAALMHVAFEVLDLEMVSVSHVVGNDKSRRAIEKYVDRFGGRREGTLRNYVAFDDGARDAVRYTVSREEYRDHHPGDLAVTVRD
jgi:ribosomal-protein-alanine N-acetyltransferase